VVTDPHAAHTRLAGLALLPSNAVHLRDGTWIRASTRHATLECAIPGAGLDVQCRTPNAPQYGCGFRHRSGEPCANQNFETVGSYRAYAGQRRTAQRSRAARRLRCGTASVRVDKMPI
jgi:hypothetical protein